MLASHVLNSVAMELTLVHINVMMEIHFRMTGAVTRALWNQQVGHVLLSHFHQCVQRFEGMDLTMVAMTETMATLSAETDAPLPAHLNPAFVVIKRVEMTSVVTVLREVAHIHVTMKTLFGEMVVTIDVQQCLDLYAQLHFQQPAQRVVMELTITS